MRVALSRISCASALAQLVSGAHLCGDFARAEQSTSQTCLLLFPTTTAPPRPRAPPHARPRTHHHRRRGGVEFADRTGLDCNVQTDVILGFIVLLLVTTCLSLLYCGYVIYRSLQRAMAMSMRGAGAPAAETVLASRRESHHQGGRKSISNGGGGGGKVHPASAPSPISSAGSAAAGAAPAAGGAAPGRGRTSITSGKKALVPAFVAACASGPFKVYLLLFVSELLCLVCTARRLHLYVSVSPAAAAVGADPLVTVSFALLTSVFFSCIVWLSYIYTDLACKSSRMGPQRASWDQLLKNMFRADLALNVMFSGSQLVSITALLYVNRVDGVDGSLSTGSKILTAHYMCVAVLMVLCAYISNHFMAVAVQALIKTDSNVAKGDGAEKSPIRVVADKADSIRKFLVSQYLQQIPVQFVMGFFPFMHSIAEYQLSAAW